MPGEEERIIQGCKNGDLQSQEKLYRQFYPAMYALCKLYFEDKHDILTAINNGMLKVFSNIFQYDPVKGKLFNWVYTCVRNEALTLVRNRKQQYYDELNEEMQQSDADSIFRKLEWKDIYLYLDLLPSRTRCICSMYYLEGFAIKEIAALLEMKGGAVKWHLYEGRNQLKPIFKPQNKQ